MMHDRGDRFERLIDQAASALTEVPDSPAFTARVLAKLQTPVAAPAAGRRRSWLVPLAAAASLVLTLAGWWQQRGVGEPGGATPGVRVPASRTLPTGSVVTPPPVSAATWLQPDDTRHSRAPGQSSRSALVVTGTRLPSYSPIGVDAVVIEPVGSGDEDVTVVPPLLLSPIAVDPLTIDPIEFAGSSSSQSPVQGERR